MNLTPSQVYWILQADTFIVASVLLTAVFGLLSALFIAITIDAGNGSQDKVGCMFIMLSSLLTIVFFLLAVFIPSTKTLTAMYILPPVVNSEIMQKDLPECIKALIESVTGNVKVTKEETK